MYLPGERGTMRAADADRDRVVDFLNTAYTEGRLSKDEYDARLDSALSARTYADLDEVVTGLPVAPATVVTPAANTNATVSCAPSPLAGGRERCAVGAEHLRGAPAADDAGRADDGGQHLAGPRRGRPGDAGGDDGGHARVGA